MFFTSNLSRSHLRCRLWPLNITCVFDKDSEAANSSIYTMYRQPNRVWVASGWDHLSRQDSYIVLMRRYHQISTRTLPSCTATLSWVQERAIGSCHARETVSLSPAVVRQGIYRYAAMMDLQAPAGGMIDTVSWSSCLWDMYKWRLHDLASGCRGRGTLLYVFLFWSCCIRFL